MRDLQTATPWNHIEAGMAYLLGHPLLVLVQEGLYLEGLVDKGYEWAINFVELDDKGNFLFPNEATLSIFKEWSYDVQAFYANMSNRNLSSVLDNISDSFNLDELKDFAFRLGINPEEVKGNTKSEYARELIDFCRRRGDLGNLLAKCRSLRPHVHW